MKLARLILIVFCALVYIRGQFIPIMNNNSAHHANIALHMHLTGDYVSLVDQGNDYLDKPHLLFWLAALSYYIFGVTSFAYKFATFVFALIGIYATYRLGKLLFSKEIGVYAALILSSSAAFILSTNDVRMDGMLTGCLIFATWQLFEFVISQKKSGFFLGALGMALGFSTKGMVALVVPALAIILYHVQQKRIKELFAWRWVGLVVLTAILLVPVLYCFYLQFDLHPEKMIRGRSGNSGVLFLLVGQSVDRYTGKGWGTRASDPFFLVHTFLWAFLPWCILAYTALIKNLRDIVRSKFSFGVSIELVLTGTTFILFLVVSGSQFKNPHYVNLLFPFFSIITARFITQVDHKYLNRIFYLQLVITCIMILLIGVINFYFIPADHVVVFAGALIILAALIYTVRKSKEAKRDQIVFLSFGGSVLCFFFLHFNFYPKLLTYQSGHGMAAEIHERNIPAESIRYLEGDEHNFSMEFSLSSLISEIPYDSIPSATKPLYVFAGEKGLAELHERKIPYQIIFERDHYNVTRLKYKFLDPATREDTFRKHYILKITSK